jgi:acyl carrier protein
MTKQEILEAVTKVFRDVLDIPDLVLSPETTARDVPEWDSLSHVQLVVGVEKRFGLRFTSKQIQSFKNVGEMCEAILHRT